VTLHDDLTRTAALLTAGWPIRNLSRAKRAQEQDSMTRPASTPILPPVASVRRADPVAEPRTTRYRLPLPHERQAIPTLTDERDVIVPPVARAIGVEAYRRQVDAMAHDPSHGISQADAMRDARRRRAHEVAWQTVKDIDGPPLPATIARLVVEALERDGVL
jgi:hypothetical protein